MTAATIFKNSLYSQGKTIRAWADQHGFPIHAVYRVLNGVEKGRKGRAHEIAVAAGLITPVPETQPQMAA